MAKEVKTRLPVRYIDEIPLKPILSDEDMEIYFNVMKRVNHYQNLTLEKVIVELEKEINMYRNRIQSLIKSDTEKYFLPYQEKETKRKMRKQINSLNNELETLRNVIKEELFTKFMAKLGEPEENKRLKKENKRLRIQNKNLKDKIKGGKNKNVRKS